VKPKIIISGPGRSGTTSLVRILTRMGEDTGYTPKNEDYRPHIRAGCEIAAGKVFKSKTIPEFRKKLNKLPYIIKSPDFCHQLRQLLEKKVMKVEHVIIPYRDAKEAAKSRMSHPDLYWFADNELEQTNANYVMIGMLIDTCLFFRIPYTIMKFPDHVKDWEYCWGKLHIIFHSINKNPGKFKKVWHEINVRK